MGKLIDFKKNIKSFEIKNKTETEAEILLYDQIGESMWGDGISSKAFSDELKKLPSSVKQINLRINSPGGSVFDGMAIYQRLKDHPAKVTAYIDGISASIASVIMMAADEIIVGDGSMIMVHKPMTGEYGNVEDFERTIDILNKIENQMIGIYAKRTGASRAEIIKMIAGQGTWMTSDEALDLKFADRSFQATETLKLVASTIENCKWMKNKPEMKSSNSLIKEKLKELTNNANSFLNKKK